MVTKYLDFVDANVKSELHIVNNSQLSTLHSSIKNKYLSDYVKHYLANYRSLRVLICSGNYRRDRLLWP